MALFSIRHMVEADVPAVILIERQIYETPWTDRNFIDSLRAGHLSHCMYLDQEFAGYIVMMQIVDEFHLLNLSIRPDLQGRGHGKNLLFWGMRQAKAANAKGMMLEVRPSNTAAKILYEKEGFELIGIRKNYYPGKNGREDAWVMFKNFAEVVS